MGQLFYSLGILASSDVVEKTPTDFGTGYVGQAAIATKKIFTESKGKVLFIDEAYLFDPAQGSGSGYGKEAVHEMVGLLTSPEFNGKMVVILAGYEDKMDIMLKINDGLRRRFTEKVIFERFSLRDCETILSSELARRKLDLEPGVESLFPKYLKEVIDHYGPNFSNAGDVIALVDDIFNASSLKFLKEGTGDVNESVLRHAVDTMKSRAPKSHASLAPRDPRFAFAGSNQAPPPPSVTSTSTTTSSSSSTSAPDTKDHDEHDHAGHGGPSGPRVAKRDAGVSDEDWIQLEAAKKIYYAEGERLEKERIRLEEEARELQRQLEEARRKAEEQRQLAIKAAQDEALRLQAEAARQAALAQQNAILQAQQRQAAMLSQVQQQQQQRVEEQRKFRGRCPAGFDWIPIGGGRYRCAGGSHMS